MIRRNSSSTDFNFMNNINSAELLTSPTEDVNKLLAALAKVHIGGKSDFITAVQVAQLGNKLIIKSL